MRRLFLLWLSVCFVWLVSANAQTVNEAESSVILNETTAEVLMIIENQAQSFDGQIALEILDAENKIRASAAPNLQIKNGKEIYKIPMPLDDSMRQAGSEIAWYRLRYRVGKAEGIVSLSELLKEVFELRVAASENVLPGMNYRVRVRALHPYTSQPVKNVKIEGELQLAVDTKAEDNRLKLKVGGATDGEGFAVLDFKIPAEIKLDDDGNIKITAGKNGVVREINEDLDADANRGSVFLTADKPLHQPGQNFSARGLYFDANQRVVAGGKLEFTIKDEDGTILYRETAKTSDYGIASINWKIPENAKLGSYLLEVEAESSLREDSIRFKVSRYDLPQFAVAATPDKSFYLPADKTAEIAVNADYLFGKPVAKGKVRVVQESERSWNYKAQKYDIREAQAFEGAADAGGRFVVAVNLKDAFAAFLDNDWQRFTDLHFAAYFTDSTTNRTEQKRFDLRLSKEPIHVYLIGRTINQNPELPITAYVSTFYADGAPAACAVEVRGKYEDEAKEKLLARIRTNRLGAGKLKFSAPREADSDDSLRFKITARDAKGQTGTFSEEVDLDDDDAVKIEVEKTIYKPGETVKINLLSTKKDALVYFDVAKEWTILESRFVKLKNGRAEIRIPYNPNFKGELTFAAYTDESDYYYDSKMRAARGIIFPAQQNLKLEANFANATYKPNEEARVNFSVSSGAGKATESALGVVVFDRAIEERARTDAEFGSYFSRFSDLLGYQKSFGGVTLKDLNDLDLSKPISPEMQLAAEVMLADSYYYPRVYHSRRNETEAASLYAAYFKKQLAPIEDALKKQYARNYAHPTDDASLRKILRAAGIDFDSLRDPWGQNYQVYFTIEKTQNIVTLRSAGADKKFDTADGFNVLSLSFAYFTPTGKAVDKAVLDYHQRTGGYVRDLPTLSAELAKQDIVLNQTKDRWNRDYRVMFEVSSRNYAIRFRSSGANGIFEPNVWNTDDFDAWTSRIDYFAKTETRINEILSQTVNSGKRPFPKEAEEFKRLLKENSLDFTLIRDGYGAPVYLAQNTQTRYADKTKIENGKQTVTPVTQEVLSFIIRSTGADGKTGGANFSDDFDLATFSSVITEALKDTNFSKVEVKTLAFSGTRGAIRGVVYDPQGAIIPNASVTATDESDTTKTFSTATNDNGEFLLGNLPSGRYSVKAEAPGFQTSVFSNIQIRAQNLVEIRFALNVGSVSSTVEVTVASESVAVATSMSYLKSGGGGGGTKEPEKAKALAQNYTPRLREYFPETLLWQPELITDKNGKAELKFKLADNITTWKLYTVASTKNGKIGVSEKEIRAFQPFFVDLEPPKFLTEGDEISLPVQVRNYTEKKQKVDVSMAQGNWFGFLNSATQQIEVAPGSSQNAVFGFKAVSAVKDGRQKVTALAQKDSDAIEKPVTVRPNGQEIVKTDSRLFSDSAAFDVNFPADALPDTQKAELKIYPNLLSHVAESVEGLLQRPYGCGEQTVSSTYPNLMILKFVKEDTALRRKAQKNLLKGYERLVGYQVADGGFSYWGGKDAPDAALTAYALRFLNDAKLFIEVDAKVIERAQDWLIKQQRADGSWAKKYYWASAPDETQTKLFTAYAARTLAALKITDEAVLQKALAYLKIRNAEIDEPYALALFGLASLDAGNAEDAKAVAAKLEKMAIAEGDSVYWKLETNTPFYGWGTAGRIETTALVLQLLTGTKSNADLISRGTMFLLKNKDRYGVWYSTQTTINVLDAFLATLSETSKSRAQNETIQISINGANSQSLSVTPNQIEPIILDLSGKLHRAENHLEVKSSTDSPVMAQVVAAHYISWKNAEISNRDVNRSRALRLEYQCDRTNAAIMQEINCAVDAERIGFKGYGMLLAEIGIPPGADVSRESLQQALAADMSFSRYDILPDRIVVYMWAKAGGTRFKFKFKPRYGVNAQTPASVVYDYYNPEAQATIAPLRFMVK